MTPRSAFIAGATGAVGQRLVRLAEAKAMPIVPHVRPKSASKLTHPRLAALELTDPKLVDALSPCTTVVQLIGTMRHRFASGDTYEASDIGTTRSLVDAAKKAGSVDHFVLLSSAGAGSLPGAYLRAKLQAETIVRESGLPFTILRPPALSDREGQDSVIAKAAWALLSKTRWRAISLDELASAILQVAMHRTPLDAVLESQSLWQVVEAAAALRSGGTS